MIETKETFINNLNAPEVIEERNKLVAARIGKELNYGAAKMQDLFIQLSAFSADPTLRRMTECLYERFWPKKDFNRETLQRVINRCHEEAFEAWQQTYMYTDVWVDD